MATIEIDGKPYEAQPGQMLIEVADANGIRIPRFCYHKKLSLAASCRMCLVEVERAPKPMPACATPIMDGMKVWTRSTKALNAQKSVMEFLLINHPLDCPICDQGGECELQDIAVGYGGDSSRYVEAKRVVFDKNIGPLVATEMTRCIHCTRCVRFGIEIAGIQEMGATGRGDHTLIGTYIEKSLNSELSGNIVDLCPVGALTAKPSRFVARAWELQQTASIAPHDSLGSNIYVHTRRGEVVRVVPKTNEAINEVWLADRDRFSYQGLNSNDRLLYPMLKQNGQWQRTDWQTALAATVSSLKTIIGQYSTDAVAALASPTATTEELYLFQKLMRGLGVKNIDHRLRQIDFSDQGVAPLYPALEQQISDIEHNQVILIVGTNLRKEHPLINHRVRKAQLNGAQIHVINPVAYDFNYILNQQLIVAPTHSAYNLAAIIKALGTKELPAAILALLDGVEINDTHKAIANSLQTAKTASIMLGDLATQQAQFSQIRALCAIIANATQATLSYLPMANSAGAWLAGVLPHRQAAGQPLASLGLDAMAMLQQDLRAYVLLALEPELDSILASSTVLQRLKQADLVVSIASYANAQALEYADILLPMANFTETSGTYVNLAGQWQSFSAAVPPKAEARPGWKILRVLGNMFELDDFTYTDSQQIAEELKLAVGEQLVDNHNAWQAPTLPNLVQQPELICELPIYSVDSIVRRAAALQQTADAKRTAYAYLNAATAAKWGINDNINFTHKLTLPVIIDEQVANGCVLVYHPELENSSQVVLSN